MCKLLHFYQHPIFKILQYCEAKRKDHSYSLPHGVGLNLLFFSFSPCFVFLC